MNFFKKPKTSMEACFLWYTGKIGPQPFKQDPGPRTLRKDPGAYHRTPDSETLTLRQDSGHWTFGQELGETYSLFFRGRGILQ